MATSARCPSEPCGAGGFTVPDTPRRPPVASDGPWASAAGHSCEPESEGVLGAGVMGDIAIIGAGVMGDRTELYEGFECGVRFTVWTGSTPALEAPAPEMSRGRDKRG